jgi:hypothetical protein
VSNTAQAATHRFISPPALLDTLGAIRMKSNDRGIDGAFIESETDDASRALTERMER